METSQLNLFTLLAMECMISEHKIDVLNTTPDGTHRQKFSESCWYEPNLD